MKTLNNKQIKEIYKLVNNRDKKIYENFRIMDKTDTKFQESKNGIYMEKTLSDMALKLGLAYNDKTKISLLNRIILLREDDLVDILNSLKLTEEEIISTKKMAYNIAETFQMNIQKELLINIEALNIPKFYKILLLGVFDVGLSMNSLHKVWDDFIINRQNPTLEKEVNGNVIEFLTKNNLLEIDSRTGEAADRAYSVLKKNHKNEYEKVPYSIAFVEEVKAVELNLKSLIYKLSEINKKDKNTEYKLWINYFKTLKAAFIEKDVSKLIVRWSKVDIDWMKIDSPIQVGHPLEYYEDKYRNAVCIEFDVRIDDMKLGKNKTVESIQPMFDNLFKKLSVYANNNVDSVYNASIENLKKVQLHIGKQVFYFGATLNGLSSAQVVPNDEIVSDQEGKKIFAFAEKTVKLGKARPPLLLSRKIFGKEIQDKSYDLLYKREKDYLKVYDITTIGHEYGHILWKTNLSEITMNKTGNYKNIEEFKASSGGLMAFFGTKEEETLWEEVFLNTTKRAVGLIGWKTVSEVEAYYCEGLITLQILFDTKVINFSNKDDKINLTFDISREKYEEFKKVYAKVYEKLVMTYLNLLDSNEFLKDFCLKEEDSFVPIVNNNWEFSQNCYDFVNYYDKLRLDLGTTIDEEYLEYIKTLR